MRIASSTRSAPSASEFAVYSGLLERHRDVALRGEVVDLVGLHLLDDADQAARIGHVAVMQDEAAVRFVRVLVQVVDAVGVEQRRAALDAVDLVAFAEQKLGEVGAVLAGDAGDLLVKTSSLGDVIHALPAITDMRAAGVAAASTGSSKESLGGNRAAASRRKQRDPGRDPALAAHASGAAGSATRSSACLRRLRAQTYDAVIDSQGLMKSALIALAARGTRYGLDFHSSREPLALFYHHAFRIPWELHAVERNRLLMARARLRSAATLRLRHQCRAAPL